MLLLQTENAAEFDHTTGGIAPANSVEASSWMYETIRMADTWLQAV